MMVKPLLVLLLLAGETSAIGRASVKMGDYGPELTYGFSQEAGYRFSRVLVKSPKAGKTFMFAARAEDGSAAIEALQVSSATNSSVLPMVEALCGDPAVSIMFSGFGPSRVVALDAESRSQACKVVGDWKELGAAAVPKAPPSGADAFGLLVSETDPVEKAVTYNAPRNRTDACVTATIIHFAGKKKPELVAYFRFDGPNWIFVEKVMVRSGGDLLTLPPARNPVRRASGSGVSETVFYSVEGVAEKAVRALCADVDAIVRLQGSDGRFDCELTSEGRQAVCTVFSAYEYIRSNPKEYARLRSANP